MSGRSRRAQEAGQEGSGGRAGGLRGCCVQHPARAELGYFGASELLPHNSVWGRSEPGAVCGRCESHAGLVNSAQGPCDPDQAELLRRSRCGLQAPVESPPVGLCRGQAPVITLVVSRANPGAVVLGHVGYDGDVHSKGVQGVHTVVAAFVEIHTMPGTETIRSVV